MEADSELRNCDMVKICFFLKQKHYTNTLKCSFYYEHEACIFISTDFPKINNLNRL